MKSRRGRGPRDDVRQETGRNRPDVSERLHSSAANGRWRIGLVSAVGIEPTT